MRFREIPDDVWIEIFENIAEPPTLARLIRTCRRFQDLAKRPLLREIRWFQSVSTVRNIESWRRGYQDLVSLPRKLTLCLSFDTNARNLAHPVSLLWYGHLLFSHNGTFRDPMKLTSTTLFIYRYRYLLVWKSLSLSTLAFHLSLIPFLLYYPIYVPSQSAIAYSCSCTVLSKTTSLADVLRLKNSFSFPIFPSPTSLSTKSWCQRKMILIHTTLSTLSPPKTSRHFLSHGTLTTLSHTELRSGYCLNSQPFQSIFPFLREISSTLWWASSNIVPSIPLLNSTLSVTIFPSNKLGLYTFPWEVLSNTEDRYPSPRFLADQLPPASINQIHQHLPIS